MLDPIKICEFGQFKEEFAVFDFIQFTLTLAYHFSEKAVQKQLLLRPARVFQKLLIKQVISTWSTIFHLFFSKLFSTLIIS